MNRINKLKLGKFGERLAIFFLQKKGFVLIAKNYRKRVGELDLIMIKNNVLHFIEVKTRTNENYGSGADAVNEFKQRKLVKMSEIFLSENPKFDRLQFQIDVAEIFIERKTKKARVKLLEDVVY